MNKKTHRAALFLAACAFVGGGCGLALAKDPEPAIASDQAGLPAELTANIARTALAMGVQEPLTISKQADTAHIAGSGRTACAVKLSGGSEPKMLGISCQ